MDGKVLVGVATIVVCVVLVPVAAVVVGTDSEVVVEITIEGLEYRFMNKAAPQAAPGSPAQAQSQSVDSAGKPTSGTTKFPQ
jgi:hypothetical protein